MNELLSNPPVPIEAAEFLNSAVSDLTSAITQATTLSSTVVSACRGERLPGHLIMLMRTILAAKKSVQNTLFSGDIAAQNDLSNRLTDELR